MMEAAARPVPRVRWRSLLVWSLLALQPCGLARAEPPMLALLRPLTAIGYPVRTTPPGFSGQTLDGRALSMADLRGKVVVMNFWASWCLECRSEMPVLERLHREMTRHGVAVVGVNAREPSEVVRRYATELGLTLPLVLDRDGRIDALYGVVGLPTTFLVGRDGRAVAYAIGPREWGGAPARALLDALLAESVAGPTAP